MAPTAYVGLAVVSGNASSPGHCHLRQRVDQFECCGGPDDYWRVSYDCTLDFKGKQ
ncbi:MAG: hypothetical protein WB762_03910 [Candidatus Sulfotelmatobacter sp.]